METIPYPLMQPPLLAPCLHLPCILQESASKFAHPIKGIGQGDVSSFAPEDVLWDLCMSGLDLNYEAWFSGCLYLRLPVRERIRPFGPEFGARGLHCEGEDLRDRPLASAGLAAVGPGHWRRGGDVGHALPPARAVRVVRDGCLTRPLVRPWFVRRLQFQPLEVILSMLHCNSCKV